MNKIISLISTLMLLLSATVEAAVIYTGGQISRVTDVAVTAVNAEWGSTGPGDPRTAHFNVDFFYGTYPDVFGGSALPVGWEFTSNSLATAGTYGLADAMDGVPGSDVFVGGMGEALLAYHVGEVSGSAGYCANCASARSVYFWPSPHTVGWAEGAYTSTTQPDALRTWAVYTQVSAVPLPATAWLMAPGFLMLIRFARRKGQR